MIFDFRLYKNAGRFSLKEDRLRAPGNRTPLFISYDGYDLKTTYKPELLNNFFDNKLDMEWHPNVIKDYNGKLLYLTSKN